MAQASPSTTTATSNRHHPTNLRYEIGTTVCPGDRIGKLRDVGEAGVGTYIREGHGYASVVGTLSVAVKTKTVKATSSTSDPAADPSAATTTTFEQHVVTVAIPANKTIPSQQVPRVGQIILGRILRIAVQQATVEIVAIENSNISRDGQQQKQTTTTTTTLHDPYEGAIRSTDVRTAGIAADNVLQIQDSFLPGDMVLCRIISLGDSRRYLLSTAEPALGVVYAVSSTSGIPMVPTSWKQMRCPETGATEARKCARPPTSSSSSSAVAAAAAAAR